MGLRSLEERFWAKVSCVPFHGCWEWTGAVQSGGYGHMNVGGKYIKAHRLAYELLVGPIPSGLVVDHLCRNPSCVRPEHLEPVTQRVNVLRGDSKMARDAVKTHCAKGHAFTPENTSVDTCGRHCVTCRRQRDRDRYARKAGR